MINESMYLELQKVKLNKTLAKKILKALPDSDSDIMTDNIEDKIKGIVREYLVKVYEHGTCYRMVFDRVNKFSNEELINFIPVIRKEVKWY